MLLLAARLLLGSVPEQSAEAPPAVFELRYTRADAILTGVALGAWLVSETALKGSLAPTQCRWCDRDTTGQDSLNALDRWGRGARWSQPSTADALSNLIGLAGAPLALGAFDFALAYTNGVP